MQSDLPPPVSSINCAPWVVQSVPRLGRSKATFVAASQTDLLWIDQVDLIAAIDDHDEIRACLEKTANTERQVRQKYSGYLIAADNL